MIDGDLLFVGSGDGGVYALRLGAASDAPKRAVFFDSTYLRASQIGNSADVAKGTPEGGYETLDAKSVAKFLEDRLADRAPSVVVFALDLPPADVVKPPLATSLLRRYLDAGGKIVWLGLPPNIRPVEPLEGQRKSLSEVQWAAPEELPAFRTATRYSTSAARAQRPSANIGGSTSRFRVTWSVAPAGVTNVLALDDWGVGRRVVERIRRRARHRFRPGTAGECAQRVPGGGVSAALIARRDPETLIQTTGHREDR